MSIKLRNTKDVGTDGVKVIVYGGAGSGKTCLCATAPRPVIFSAESGLLSLRGIEIPYIQIDSYKDLEEAYAWTFGSSEAKNFDTICLDSISEIAEVVLGKLKETHKDPRKAYGEVQDEMLGLLRSFRDIKGKNVYFSAKMERIKDEGTGVTRFGPMMPGTKLPQQVPYFFDEVFQLQVFVDPQTKAEIRALRTRRDNQYEAKDRSGSLELWEQPDLAAIFNKISGKQP